MLYQVSTPGNGQYAHYMAQKDIKQLIKPSSHGKEAVLAWLKDYDVKVTQDLDEEVRISTTIGNAETMLGTNFSVFQHRLEQSETKIRTLKVMLPHNIANYIQLIHPTTYFDQIKPLTANFLPTEIVSNSQIESCSSGVTPSCLEDLYDIKGFDIADRTKVGRIGVPGFLGNVASAKDLEQFLNSTPSRAKGANFTISLVNGKISIWLLIHPKADLELSFNRRIYDWRPRRLNGSKLGHSVYRLSYPSTPKPLLRYRKECSIGSRFGSTKCC
jgi:tripeptidyl-peptidase-1